MMRLSFMLDFLNSDLANTMIERFEHDEDTLRFFRASANFVYIFKNKGQTQFLRLNHEEERAYPLLVDEMNVLNYFSTQGIQVAKPIKSLQNNYVESFDTELGRINAVVFEGVDGFIYDEIEDVTPNDLFKWGKALGQIHRVSQTIPDDLTTNRPSYEDLLNEVLSSTDDDLITYEVEYLKKEFLKLNQNKSNYGLIHFDFEIDNLIWKEHLIYSIDYDDSCKHWFVADILYALRDLEEIKWDEFLNGYQTETKIDEAIYDKKHLFEKMHHLHQYARLKRAVDIQENENNPAWMNQLIRKLENRIQDLYTHFED